MSRLSCSVPPGLLLGAASLVQLAVAHEHHHEGPADTSVPVDSILWIHIGVQIVAWFFLFPLAMVLGMVRHRLHVPVATLSLSLTVGGYFLGHSHKGRSFPHTAHGTMASFLVFYLAAQASLGIYLKLHLQWRPEKWIRPTLVGVHGVLGKSFPIVGWVQMVFGLSTLQSWCFGGHLGQCLAHYIMGSAFQAYAAILVIMMKAGGDWLQRRGQSQEWFDSWVIMLFGIVNTFTEHHGGPWTHKDLQHTMMGVLWWAGGAVGIWLSRGGRRNVFPAIILGLTGWAMSAHAQALMISTHIHGLFGYALMGAGIARAIEVCFVVQDRPTGTVDGSWLPQRFSEPFHGSYYPIRAFQYLPPYLLVASGVLFMSATDEELRWADGRGVDHATWGLIDFSLSMLVFLWINVLVDLYVNFGGRYGARTSNISQTVSGDREAHGGHTLYSRLDADQNGTDPEQFELSAKRASSSIDVDERSPNHVLFDEDDQESFDDKHGESSSSNTSSAGRKERGGGRIQL